MKVYTYYEPPPFNPPAESPNIHEQLRLLLLWRANWTAAGFEPVVLNGYHAMQRNGDGAPQWRAMALVGGGLYVDYAVFNYGWEFKESKGKSGRTTKMPGLPVLHANPLVFGTLADGKSEFFKPSFEGAEYLTEHWQTAPLVWYSEQSTRGIESRATTIPTLRQQFDWEANRP